MKGKRDLRLDGARLWDSLMEMAKVGATQKGGSCPGGHPNSRTCGRVKLPHPEYL